MSLFGKLFKKKEKPQEPVSTNTDTTYVDTPWGEFSYNGIKYQKFEYEGYVNWYESDDDECDVFIECNEEGSDDMSKGLEKLTQIMANKEDIDYQVKMTALDFFADESGLVMSESKEMLMSKDFFLDAMHISGIDIHRDGRVVFQILDCDFLDVESVYVVFRDDAPAKVYVLHFGDNSSEFFSNPEIF